MLRSLALYLWEFRWYWRLEESVKIGGGGFGDRAMLGSNPNRKGSQV